MKSAKLQKKIILVVTDGEDTASRDTLEQAVRVIAVDGGPTVYSIGLLGREREKKARRALRILAEQTGGVAFFPVDVNEVEAISQQIAHDIRNQYTIGYRPSTPKTEGGYRQVKVDAVAKGYKKLSGADPQRILCDRPANNVGKQVEVHSMKSIADLALARTFA